MSLSRRSDDGSKGITSNSQPGRILIASYHFPPDAAVGGLRVAKFARFLSEFGWDPHVLTVNDNLREAGLDESRLQGLETLPIIRTSELPRVVEAPSRIKAMILGRKGNPVTIPGTEMAPDQGRRETLMARLKRYFCSLFVFLPDEKKNWSLYAAPIAVRLIKRKSIDWVLTSGPPFSAHVVGLLAKVFTRVKWIADFRDPWIDMLPVRFPHTRSALSDRLERWMESAVAKHADRVVTTTERMRNAMVARYPSLPPEKFVSIPNSIDVEKFQVNSPIDKYGILTITYAGNLYFDRTPEPLFHAVSQLITSGRASVRDIRIKLVGHCQNIEGVETRLVARRYGLDEVVEVVDRVPYSEAVRIMQRSHLLLVLAPEHHRLVVPAKIYDYLGAGSTVVALADDGATADLVDETRCGRHFSPSDVDGLRDYLDSLLRNDDFRNLKNEPRFLPSYDGRAIVRRLVAEMSAIGAHLGDRVTVRT